MKHPSKYTDSFIPIFAGILKGSKKICDPMAGTGKIALIREHGYKGEIHCCEIEPEWTGQFKGVNFWHIGDATDLSFFKEGYFDAICTSPTYGNRMADHFEAKDSSKRITYRHYLGKPLHLNNTGRMQWGDKYRTTHLTIYLECSRILKSQGLFILNVSDHIRQGKQMLVTDWHKRTLQNLGFSCIGDLKVKTSRMGFGANNNVRVNYERIMTFRNDNLT